MQPTDTYEKRPVSGLRRPEQANSDAAKEFIARLTAYQQHLGNITPETIETAVHGVIGGMTDVGSQWDTHREMISQDIAPLIIRILEMEQRWLLNVCRSLESAEVHSAENAESFVTHSKDVAELGPAEKKLERLLSQRETVQGWSISQIKRKRLTQIDSQIQKVTPKTPRLLHNIQQRYGDRYFEGLRRYLRGRGFIVAPSYLPPAAVFPREDWISLEPELPSFEALSTAADELMLKYRLLGTPYSGVLYNTSNPRNQTKCGCVCVSWVFATCVTDDERMIVPILGMSGGAPSKTNVNGIEAMLGACALPPYTSMLGKGFCTRALQEVTDGPAQVDFNQYYDDIMARANNLAINYRVREFMRLRLPSRQAMLSYLGLSFFVPSREQVAESATSIEPTPGITRWHSFNCAEPAALAWITSFFVDGQDVHLCCPYEGMDDPGAWGLKPKETCPWCATVEIAYRSMRRVHIEEVEDWSKTYDESMRTGEWVREITHAAAYQDMPTDTAWREGLPRNKPQFEAAYPRAVNDNIAVLRDIFYELGILENSTIRVDVPALWQS